MYTACRWKQLFIDSDRANKRFMPRNTKKAKLFQLGQVVTEIQNAMVFNANVSNSGNAAMHKLRYSSRPDNTTFYMYGRVKWHK